MSGCTCGEPKGAHYPGCAVLCNEPFPASDLGTTAFSHMTCTQFAGHPSEEHSAQHSTPGGGGEMTFSWNTRLILEMRAARERLGERSDPEAGEHVDPHRGCMLR